MRPIGVKVVDMSEYGYDEPVVFKELTLNDMAKITAATKRAMKNEEDFSDAVSNMILLEHLIKSAPFPKTREAIGDLPFSTAIYLIEEAQVMLDPLLKRKNKESSTTTQGVEPTTPLSPDTLTVTNYSEGDSQADK